LLLAQLIGIALDAHDELSFFDVTKVTTNRGLERCRESRVFVAFRLGQPEQIDLIKMSTRKPRTT
jgi:hypothetical protein